MDHADIDHTGLTGVGGSVATDAIWDAAGDLAVGSGANTAAKLTKGSDGDVLTVVSGSVAWSPGGGGSVPGWVSAFVGTTDSTHFYWDGNDLASFTGQTVSGSATWAEAGNLASALVSNQTSDDAAAMLIAETISVGDAWILPIRTDILMSDSGGSTSGNRSAGIAFTDGTTTGANCVVGHVQMSNDPAAPASVLVGRHGTLTAITTAPWVSTTQVYPSGWLYLKLTYQASNTFRLEMSPNGVQYSAFGEADISKTMTPTHVGLVAWNYQAGTAIATFGPLKKV